MLRMCCSRKNPPTRYGQPAEAQYPANAYGLPVLFPLNNLFYPADMEWVIEDQACRLEADSVLA